MRGLNAFIHCTFTRLDPATQVSPTRVAMHQSLYILLILVNALRAKNKGELPLVFVYYIKNDLL